MTRGLLANDTLGAWTRYPLEIRCAGAGALTQPFFDKYNGTYQFGRYAQDIDTGWVDAQIQIAFIGATTVGAGDAYIVRLPKPVMRLTPSQSREPIGTAMCYWSFLPAPNQNMPSIVTPADPFASVRGDEDNWCQILAPEILDQGIATIPNGAGNVTVNHKAGFAFNPSDVQLTIGDLAGLSIASGRFVLADTITATTFRIASNSNTSDDTKIAWTIRATPNPATAFGNIVSPTVPWAWNKFTSLGPFGNIFISLGYRGRLT